MGDKGLSGIAVNGYRIGMTAPVWESEKKNALSHVATKAQLFWGRKGSSENEPRRSPEWGRKGGGWGEERLRPGPRQKLE